jgi:hypothetical protein
MAAKEESAEPVATAELVAMVQMAQPRPLPASTAAWVVTVAEAATVEPEEPEEPVVLPSESALLV